MTIRPDDDDVTRVQSPLARAFNEQLHQAAYPQPRPDPHGLYRQPTFATGSPHTQMTVPISTPGNPPTPPVEMEPPADLRGIPGVPRRAHSAQPPPKTQPRRFGVVTLIGVALVSSAVGALAMLYTHAGDTTDTIQPTVSSTPTVVTKEVTPQSCVDALHASDNGFAIVSKVLDAAGQAMYGVATNDADLINRQVKRLEKYKKQIDPVSDVYRSERDACFATKR